MLTYIFVSIYLRIYLLETRRDVFQAIADPTRRRIITLLAHKTLNLNSVAEKFDMSRPAISQHIKILVECGLITIQQQGRERYCEVKLDQLTEVTDWVTESKKVWAQRFGQLESFLTGLQTPSAIEESKKQKRKKAKRKKKDGKKNK